MGKISLYNLGDFDIIVEESGELRSVDASITGEMFQTFVTLEKKDVKNWLDTIVPDYSDFDLNRDGVKLVAFIDEANGVMNIVDKKLWNYCCIHYHCPEFVQEETTMKITERLRCFFNVTGMRYLEQHSWGPKKQTSPKLYFSGYEVAEQIEELEDKSKKLAEAAQAMRDLLDFGVCYPEEPKS
jgi:hypothetical protein